MNELNFRILDIEIDSMFHEFTNELDENIFAIMESDGMTARNENNESLLTKLINFITGLVKKVSDSIMGLFSSKSSKNADVVEKQFDVTDQVINDPAVKDKVIEIPNLKADAQECMDYMKDVEKEVSMAISQDFKNEAEAEKYIEDMKKRLVDKYANLIGEKEKKDVQVIVKEAHGKIKAAIKQRKTEANKINKAFEKTSASINKKISKIKNKSAEVIRIVSGGIAHIMKVMTSTVLKYTTEFINKPMTTAAKFVTFCIGLGVLKMGVNKIVVPLIKSELPKK